MPRKSYIINNPDHITNEIFVTNSSGTHPNYDNFSKLNPITHSATFVHHGSQLSFHDINYTISVQYGICKKAEEKCILNNVTGIFKSGMNAIMGPTGGGKTTLLNVLAGRVDMSKVEGCVLVDGMKQPSNFRCMAGYVAQDDVVMGTLTVRENLMFSANLRLSKTISKADKKRRVENAIYELGLTSCADFKVGSEIVRGISGGERKRTNIGMELIISPKVLFLDEPTTGLDSSTANAVMSLLNTISKNGKTIIFSIHQPRYNIFKLFDTMLLLGAGKTVYHGPASDTLNYFHSIGYECEEHNNPSDFFLDVTNGDSTAVQALNKRNHDISSKHTSNVDKSLVNNLADEFSRSQIATDLYNETSSIYQSYTSKQLEGHKMKKPVILYATSFCTQLRYVSKRAITNIVRNPFAMLLQIIVMICFALFVGIIFFQLGTKIEGAIQNRIGAFFFVIMNQVFGNLSSIELFLRERVIFIHECSGGFYRVSAYFWSKYLCDLIPMRIVPLTCFCFIAYFMVGFQLNAEKFFIFYLTFCLTAMSSSTVGFAISSSVRTFSIAHLTLTFVYVFMQVFGGYLVNLTTMPAWLSWMQYLSIVRYSLNALSITELKDLVLYNNGTEVRNLGTQYLKEQGIKYETAWDLWQNEVAMILIVIIMLSIAYIQLLRNSRIR